MADVVRAGYVISLRYLRNILPGEDIYAVEQHYIREYGCLSKGIGLNAQRQDREHLKASATQTTEMRAMKVTTGIAEATQKDEYGLESFRQLIATHFPQLQSRAGVRRYSFKTHDNVRIVRAEQETPTGRVNIKLALTSRREGGVRTFNWDGTPAQVLDAVRGELHLYEQYFNKA